MLSKWILALFAVSSTPALANTLDFYAGVRRADINDVKWKGTEYGVSYLLDIDEIVAIGPYLASSVWDIRNDELQTKAKADYREVGPEVRAVIPLESFNFIAGASYALVSSGTAKTEDGRGADVKVEGFRFRIGFDIPVTEHLGLNVGFIKGVQTVTIKHNDERARESMDDLALSFGLNF